MTAIPALTLHRPWAELILRGVKDVENRSWYTNYRGPLYIHAGVAWDPHAEAFALARGVAVCAYGPGHPTGIVGVVDLVDVLNGTSPSPWAMRDQYHWRLSNLRGFVELVPCKGRQKLWLPPTEVRLQLEALDAVA